MKTDRNDRSGAASAIDQTHVVRREKVCVCVSRLLWRRLNNKINFRIYIKSYHVVVNAESRVRNGLWAHFTLLLSLSLTLFNDLPSLDVYFLRCSMGFCLLIVS